MGRQVLLALNASSGGSVSVASYLLATHRRDNMNTGSTSGHSTTCTGALALNASSGARSALRIAPNQV